MSSARDPKGRNKKRKAKKDDDDSLDLPRVSVQRTAPVFAGDLTKDEDVLPLRFDVRTEKYYQHRKSQVALARQLAKMLTDPERNGVACLNARTDYGKTILAGQTVALVHQEFQRNELTEGRTLVLYMALSGFGTGQAVGVGSYTDKPFKFGDASAKKLLKTELDERGVAVVMMKAKSFQSLFNGRRGPNDKAFFHLDEEDFEQNSDLLKNVPLPNLIRLVSEMSIKNVVVIADEYHLILNQDDGKLAHALANHKRFASSDLTSTKFNLYVLGLSATPGEEPSKSSCTPSRFRMSQMLFHTLKPLPKATEDVEQETVDEAKARVSIVVGSDYDPKAADIFAWMRGKDHEDVMQRYCRTQHIMDPFDSNSRVFEQVAVLLAVVALVPVRSTHNGWENVRGIFDVSNGNVLVELNKERARKAAKRAGDVNMTITPAKARSMYESLLVDIDTASFINGYVKEQLKHISTLNPQRAKMRRVVEVDGFEPTFETVMHYHSILVCIDTDEEFAPLHSKHAVSAINDDPLSKSVIFDIRDCSHESMERLVNTEAIPTWRRNEKQVLVVAYARDLTGNTMFAAFCNIVVFIGKTKELRIQSFHRVARCPMPEVGMVVPMPDDGYHAYSLNSTFASALERDATNCLSGIDLLPETSPERILYNELKSSDHGAMTQLGRYMFKLSPSKTIRASPVSILYPKLLYPGFGTPFEAFARLIKERALNSETWKEEFTRFLRYMKAIHAALLEENDESDD